MATRADTIAYLLDQLAGAGPVSARKMFGEYALYCDGRVVALVCDDDLYLKPTAAGRARLGAVEEAPPYPGAKPCFLIPGDRWDDGDWLSELFRRSAAELPLPKPKPKKKPKPEKKSPALSRGNPASGRTR